MTSEEEASLQEAQRRFHEQVWATRWLRTEVEGLERRRAAGDETVGAELAVKRPELAMAEARWIELDQAVGRALAPTVRALVADIGDTQKVSAALLFLARERYKADPEQSAAAEAEIRQLLATHTSARDIEREVLALLAKFG